MDMFVGLKEGLIFAKLGLIFCECDDNSLRRVTVCLAYVEVARQLPCSQLYYCGCPSTILGSS